jgi:pilus assembly protein Flp/PilA
MLNSYIRVREAVLRLRDDQDGVVSFEYVIVAACVVAAVAAAFTNQTGGLTSTLESAIGAIAGKVTAALTKAG